MTIFSDHFNASGNTAFSWIEYQALMFALAGVICSALFVIEIALNRFQVLPLLFPGMFRVHERRFYFFNFDITDGAVGKSIRAEAKMAVRVTICLVLSYLWQHCVLSTSQQVGREFPTDACNEGADCFASDLHFTTLFNRNYEAIDCSKKEDFSSRVVVSCIRVVPPTATTWLMHLAISHSVTQLNFKSFELMVWIGGNSKWSRRIIGALIFSSLSAFVALFFSGVMTEFVSSWLSFVMSLTVPLFLMTVYRNSKNLEYLWKEDSVKVQCKIEESLNGAFADIEHAIKENKETVEGDVSWPDIALRSNGLSFVKERESKKQDRRVLSQLRNMTTAVAGKMKGGRKNINTDAPKLQEAEATDSGETHADEALLSRNLVAALDSATREGSSK